ncbi:hypothetical protein AQ477_27915 [Burkholderia thailandensis]|nr:hypothetical protein AQ477_27915 [Burkholderia thailandensis]KXF59702.1 hypothetical protein AQ476_20855 [Burkholderia thailandensis]PNE79176.1 hypothetical protein A8H37_07085 [Burkholderia thailandensis]
MPIAFETNDADSLRSSCDHADGPPFTSHVRAFRPAHPFAASRRSRFVMKATVNRASPHRSTSKLLRS